MDHRTHPAAFAYAAARCEARRLADRYAPQAVRAAHGLAVLRTGREARKEDAAAAQAVRAALAIDASLTDPGLVLARAAELLPA